MINCRRISDSDDEDDDDNKVSNSNIMSENENDDNDNSNIMNDVVVVNEERDTNNSNNDDFLVNEPTSKNNCLCCLQVVEGQSRCSKCRTALYCTRDCQVKHWPVHKNICMNSNSSDGDKKLEMKAHNHFKQGNYIYIYIKR
jgi:hypothetical protein